MEGLTTQVNVRLERASALTLVVLDEGGQPIPGAEVTFSCDAIKPLDSRMLRRFEPPGWGGFTTNRQGVLIKPFFPATEIVVGVQARGFRREIRTLQLREGVAARLEIRMRRTR